MANTYTLISSVTVGSSGAATIDFTSIPSTYTDLLVKVSLRSNNAANTDTLFCNFNGNTSTNFTSRRLSGQGTTASGATFTGNTEMHLFSTVVGANATASTFSNSDIYIPNYAGSANKSASYDGVTENNATNALAALLAGLWSNTAAINRVTLSCTGSFVQYSTAYLYGIKNS
jgi:hypothetical protein